MMYPTSPSKCPIDALGLCDFRKRSAARRPARVASALVACLAALCGAATGQPSTAPSPAASGRQADAGETAPRAADEREANEARMREELRYLRTQVILFRMQHHGTPPGYPDGDTTRPADPATFLAQMTGYTDDACRVSEAPDASHRHGPYLLRLPVNPLNGSSVLRVAARDGSPGHDAAPECGWVYNPRTREVAANSTGSDRQGVASTDK